MGSTRCFFCLLPLSVALNLVGCGARTSVFLDDSLAPEAGIDAALDHHTPPPTDAGSDVVLGRDTGTRDAGLDAMDADSGFDAADADAANLGAILYIPASQVTGEWQGEGFAVLPAPVSPPARDQTALASDGNDIVLFGGLLATNTFSDDTWQFSGTEWSMATPNASPTLRGSHSMARQGVTGNSVVLFGGVSGAATSSVLGDTWIWSSGDWSEVHPATSPSPRSLAAMAPLGDSIVLYGGSDANGNPLGDTWIWDGTTWTSVAVHGGIGPRPQAGITMLAPLGDVVVLFVPDEGSNDMVSWTFDGAAWMLQGGMGGALDPSALDAFGSTTLGSSILIYGGYSAVTDEAGQGSFEWNGSAWSLFSPQTLQPSTVTGATPSLMATLDRQP